MSKRVVQAGYDAMGIAYTAQRQLDGEQRDMLQDLMSRLPADAQVLDAGCGSGVPVTTWLSERAHVTGVDISEAQIAAAVRTVPGAKFICQDMTELNFPDESFDAICSLYAVIHIPREEHRRLLKRFHHMLRPGGLLLLCMGSNDWPGEVEEFFGTPMYWSHFDSETNLAMTQECGFRVVWSRMVLDGVNPETGATHLFLLAQKKSSACKGL